MPAEMALQMTQRYREIVLVVAEQKLQFLVQARVVWHLGKGIWEKTYGLNIICDLIWEKGP